ncbi:hypothetical protein OO256_06410 [Pseudomonas sp. DCB_CB]|uniref:hypothetical protein n=1 Tax=Pseudomonas TaxID=286 RepID=UPI002248E794|nr:MULTISPECIES: hypothetical protein [unclassified Pseudomonas]MCX2690109.1 hypothetical protein [Pseudomonas sp. DCB_BZ]MCX2855733.1 hypothetical protein [Pseudomonas sp. DCB_CB]
MFETHMGSNLDSCFVLEEETHRWGCVYLKGEDAWLHVVHETQIGAAATEMVRKQYMFPNVPFFLGLVERAGAGSRVVSVQLVSPPAMNKTPGWKMDALHSIRIFGVDYIYELADGTVMPMTHAKQLLFAQILWAKL